MADKLYTVVDGMPSELNLGSGGSLPGIDERVTALEAYQIEQDQALADLEAVIEANRGMLPLGFEYVRLTGQAAYAGGVDYMGQLATRAMYADLWAWLNENKPDAIISEDEWQTLYASQNGNVGKFSEGDGSTTFRFPRVVSYLKGTADIKELGQYIKEGLPNIKGAIGGMGNRFFLENIAAEIAGAFRVSGNNNVNMIQQTGETLSGYQTYYRGNFDASLSNAAYGNSQHVTPETITIVMGVIAFGTTVSLGEATEEGILKELANLAAQLGNLEAAIEAFHDNQVGEVFAWPADSEPYRALPINGAAVSRTTYAKLFAKIGTKYGAGNGSTTFNVPNGIDKFLQCGNTAGIVKAAGLPNIVGTIGYRPGSGNTSGIGGAFYMGGGNSGSYGSSMTASSVIAFSAANSNGLFGASPTVQPPSLTMRYYIKY